MQEFRSSCRYCDEQAAIAQKKTDVAARGA
jgi:hypothetical protein